MKTNLGLGRKSASGWVLGVATLVALPAGAGTGTEPNSPLNCSPDQQGFCSIPVNASPTKPVNGNCAVVVRHLVRFDRTAKGVKWVIAANQKAIEYQFKAGQGVRIDGANTGGVRYFARDQISSKATEEVHLADTRDKRSFNYTILLQWREGGGTWQDCKPFDPAIANDY